MSDAPTIVWLRHDLRLRDHAALCDAVAAGPVVPVFTWHPQDEGEWPPGAASRWWLHHSLAALDAALRERGSRLTLRIGPADRELAALAAETGATRVTWQRRYEPHSIAHDTRLKASLRERGLEATSHAGALLIEPWALENQSGRPFQVFTPFWRAAVARIGEVEPRPAPAALVPPQRWPRSATLAELDLLPRIRWDAGLASEWTPGEAGAQARLERFIDEAFEAYADARDRPAVPGTSRLSPHLHFGELTPRQAWRAVRARCEHRGGTRGEWRSSKFLAEIGWREFAHHLLYHFPRLPTEPLRPEFARFPWREDAAALEAWRCGRTGVPLVDAGMRELWATGYMHNRVRMIVASLLVKNLRIHWLEGARWFWDTLVDADLANNTQGWQWTAGCGADAAPFFRIFNPVTQGLRFDPDGAYVRRWLPELRALAAPAVHAPWEADEAELHAAGVVLGRDYPRPIVDLKSSRAAALDAFQRMRAA